MWQSTISVTILQPSLNLCPLSCKLSVPPYNDILVCPSLDSRLNHVTCFEQWDIGRCEKSKHFEWLVHWGILSCASATAIRTCLLDNWTYEAELSCPSWSHPKSVHPYCIPDIWADKISKATQPSLDQLNPIDTWGINVDCCVLLRVCDYLLCTKKTDWYSHGIVVKVK